MLNQFVVQLSGVVLCIVWSTVASYPVFWLLRRRIGLWFSPSVEMSGASLDNPEWPYSPSGDLPNTEDAAESDQDSLRRNRLVKGCRVVRG